MLHCCYGMVHLLWQRYFYLRESPLSTLFQRSVSNHSCGYLIRFTLLVVPWHVFLHTGPQSRAPADRSSPRWDTLLSPLVVDQRILPLLYSAFLAPQSRMWGQNTLILSSLSPKRDWGPKKVKSIPTVPYCTYLYLLYLLCRTVVQHMTSRHFPE